MDMVDWQNTHAFSVMIYLNGSDIPEVDWYGTQLVVDAHNPDGPELNYEAGFAITAQSRSFLLLMSDRKPEAQRKF